MYTAKLEQFMLTYILFLYTSIKVLFKFAILFRVSDLLHTILSALRSINHFQSFSPSQFTSIQRYSHFTS